MKPTITLLMAVLLFSCERTAVTKEQSREKKSFTTVYLIGDSTMADKPLEGGNPERGWCQLMPEFMTGNVTLENHAVNGRSSRSFISEGCWDKVLSRLKQGDYVFIQFGHNDQKFKDPSRYTNPYTGYRQNLEKFVQETREKGATPILFTSIVRRNFNEYGTLMDTHGDYPLVVRLVADDMDVPFIDLQRLTENLEISYGPERSEELHLWYTPGEIPFYPEGKQDNTHLSVKGAREVAGLAVETLKNMIPELARYLK
ncbi:rhamnogalacturonan acetylesterase [Sinomicrobium weinanense]|uniref:Rhamnogalacturonan acetylesterase n=1 Tax=Sinomicrobium weinanense TaxID=2842200 RepID=A0A926JTH4_9FLAO|nr:rhamnogalacturonan acetylesterase [Sinomicrobium weinanense]MBC9797218.1 rhamnogalacturonan acetylesterase [Sinomicrobium weinanense]MBU3125569.1 rhamnogalacturonan acetylesterase [Sinomicrobium weinanense]